MKKPPSEVEALFSGVGSNQIESETTTTHRHPKKPVWWKTYPVTLSLVVAGVLDVSRTYWYIHSNPPPQLSELERQNVRILSWKAPHPQLYVQLANGHRRMVEFPTLDIRPDLYFDIPFEAQKALVGEECEMAGRPMKFSIQDSYQVFGLNCSGGKSLDFSKAKKSYEEEFEIRASNVFPITARVWELGVILFFFLEIMRNRKLAKGVK